MSVCVCSFVFASSDIVCVYITIAIFCPSHFLVPSHSSLKMEHNGSIIEAGVLDLSYEIIEDDGYEVVEDDGWALPVTVDYQFHETMRQPMRQQSSSSSDGLPREAKPQALFDAYVQRTLRPNLTQLQMAHMEEHRHLQLCPVPRYLRWCAAEETWCCCIERFVTAWWPCIVLQGCSVDHEADYHELLAIASASKFHRTIFKEEQQVLRTSYLFIMLCNHSITMAQKLDKLLTMHLRLGNPVPSVEQVKVLAQIMAVEDDDSESD